MAIKPRHFRPETDPLLYKCPCGRAECDAPPPSSTLLYTLDVMRDDLGEAITVTSGPRCAVHNAAEGGVKDSEHLTGQGADLQCLTSAQRWKMLESAKRAGFRRIGIGRTFLHVGVETTGHATEVVWTYYGETKTRTSEQ